MNNEKKKVKSRSRKKKTSTVNLKKSINKKKSVSKKKNSNVKIEGLEHALISKYSYNPNNSESKRKRSLGNAVVVYDPKGLHDFLQNLISKNIHNKTIVDALKKDSDFVIKTYYHLIR